MNNKEKVVRLLEYVPDYKMGYVLAYVQGLTADEEIDSITQISSEKTPGQAFLGLKGIAGCELDQDQVREERLRERFGSVISQTP